jgi:preprotein translocase subunit SecG
MIVALTMIHIVICFFLVIVVLLQSGKAADLAGAFGGMGSQTAFGPRGSATILSKATTIAASLFMVTSLTLAILATRNAGSARTVLEQRPARAPQTAPVRPPAPAGVPGGQPSVTLTPEGGGPPRTVPLNIPPPPAPGQQAPVAPAKPAPKPATPPAK